MTFEKVSKPTGYENEHNTKSAAKIVENGEKKNGVDPLKEGLERVVDTNIDIKIEDASWVIDVCEMKNVLNANRDILWGLESMLWGGSKTAQAFQLRELGCLI